MRRWLVILLEAFLVAGCSKKDPESATSESSTLGSPKAWDEQDVEAAAEAARVGNFEKLKFICGGIISK